MEKTPIPEEQWAIISPSKGKLQIAKIPVPKPASGQVLIKVDSAPLNPSDLYCMKGMYDEFDIFKFKYPQPQGWEGSGVVVASGGGMMANRAVGKNVSFVRPVTQPNTFDAGGSYQQYCLADGMTVGPVDASIPMDVASMSFVNPLTALGLVESIKKNKSSAAVQTGAASQLGRMIMRVCKTENIQLINIVRREEQVKMLKEEHGQKYVLNSTSEGFFDELKALAKELKATTLLDAVAGNQFGKLLECMPNRSTAYIYGALSEEGPGEIDALMLIGRSYKVEGWILGTYITSKGMGIVKVIGKANALMKDKTFQSVIQKKFKLTEFQQSVGDYYANMTGGKFIFSPNEENGEDGKEYPIFDLSELNTNKQ